MLAASQTTKATPTFSRDIAPIIYHNCADCHRPGEAGPFPLLSYEDVKKHARQIAAVTQARFMPPWLPEPGPFPIAGERRLSDAQLELIRRWVEAGTPEGDPSAAPQPPHFEAGWQLGKPDLIVTAAKPFQLPASGTDVYWNFVLPVPLDRTRWVKGVEIRPGDKRLVHHANILIDRLGSSRALEKEPGAGFGGMDIRVESEAFDPDSHLLFWKPGTPATEQPRGMALRMDPGTDLLLNVHLQPSGKPEWIQPSVGLSFTDEPATLHPMLLELENDSALHIPAGAKDFRVSDTFTLPVDVSLLAIYPHAHYLGKHLEAIATFPDGRQKTLLNIPHWDLNWQAVYTYAQPVALPKGTSVEMRYQYDNSSDNVRNPNNPPALVTGGNRAKDEMAHLWLQVLPVQTNVDPRLVLQEALSRHQVEKDPTIFEAQYNLAAMLMNRGETAEAISHYAMAAKIRPRDPVVSNALGAAEMSAGQLQSAARDLQTAIDLRPDYFDAHYNLGLALASAGDFSRAESELRRATQLKPQDANAHANLGAALAQLGKLSQAQNELELALKLNPESQLAQENLELLQQMLRKN
ncbi:MAG TPA: tetratricopeptide repeat protein [Bryobacteraceae bacterium]|jgi:Flp pilus assembly protein TadD|nr:tetratricopeptide repeat protein [Bryobacteraceae bacterium]